MRFQITAALVAAATLITGAVADDHTTQTTLYLTRTVMRVEHTVTATRTPSGPVGTGVPSASWTSGYYNGSTVSTASLTATAPSGQFTGAAVPLNAEMIGMAAVAGLAGLLAL